MYFWLVDDIYDDLYGHDILHSLSKAHRFNTWMADAVKPWVGEHVQEIGAGLGNLSSKMLPREAYTASDLDPLYLDYLKSRFNNNPTVDVRKVDLENTEDFNEIEGRFDSIICLNVLEHVNKSDLALQNMYRALTPGGTAIILVPQGQWLYGSLDRVLEHHLRYSRKQLIEKCTAAGFEMEKVFTFNRMGLWPWFINGKIFRRKRFNKLQLKFFDTFVWLWRRLDRFLPWPGLSVVGIARKPR